MTHDEFEALLGAYALDAVDEGEARAIEEHLAICPRCRAELAAHRNVAGMLGNGGAEAPVGLWERISGELHDGRAGPEGADVLIARLHSRRTPQRRLVVLIGGVVAACAVVLLSLQVAHLANQVHHLETPGAAQTLAASVNQALASPHTTITLASPSRTLDAEVIVTRDGTAYWINSNLASLGPNETYQLWGLRSSDNVVSLGLLGDRADRYSAFRIEPGTRSLMITVEPTGGTRTPTSAVLLSGSVPLTI
jgi:anti-sigma-K factor RskA